jgi:hypothetical protein
MKTLMSTLLVIAAASNMAVAGDKPDFSGNWKLDTDKSTFGPLPPPASMTAKIKHTEPDLVIETTSDNGQGAQTSTSKYSTDGKETTNSMMGNDVKSKAGWEGNVLVVNSNMDMGGAAVKLVAKYSLSDDGKTLTQTLNIDSPQGAFDLAFVLVKQ